MKHEETGVESQKKRNEMCLIESEVMWWRGEKRNLCPGGSASKNSSWKLAGEGSWLALASATAIAASLKLAQRPSQPSAEAGAGESQASSGLAFNGWTSETWRGRAMSSERRPYVKRREEKRSCSPTCRRRKETEKCPSAPAERNFPAACPWGWPWRKPYGEKMKKRRK